MEQEGRVQSGEFAVEQQGGCCIPERRGQRHGEKEVSTQGGQKQEAPEGELAPMGSLLGLGSGVPKFSETDWLVERGLFCPSQCSALSAPKDLNL